MFGWIPVFLWIVIGGIFVGAAHDMGSMLASIRNKGLSISHVISDSISRRSKRMFEIVVYFALVLIIAAFTSIVADTFGATGANEYADSANGTAATTSMCLITAAFLLGYVMNRFGLRTLCSAILCIGIVIVCGAIGFAFPASLSPSSWMVIILVYTAVASILPVWMLLQPRDYLCSFLLYGLMASSFVGIVLANPDVNLPGFTEFHSDIGMLFPALFVTVACGAVSGFHSMVSSGTTSKQVDRESNVLPIGYGGMILESVVAIMALIAVGTLFIDGMPSGTPVEIFARGITDMLSTIGLDGCEDLAYSMIILALSSFALTSLDTSARLARYLFQEMFDSDDDAEPAGLTRILRNPYVATAVTIVLAFAFGLIGYRSLWSLFGTMNQFMAVFALIAVSAWLSDIGREYRMLLIPMLFMLIVSMVSLATMIFTDASALMDGFDAWPAVRAVIASLMYIPAGIIAWDGIGSILHGRDGDPTG